MKKSVAPRVGDSAELEPFRRLVKIRADVPRGKIITSTAGSGRNFTILLAGLACMTARHEDGARQIHAFHHAGDFLALQGFLHPGSTQLIEVEALSNCSIGTIDHDVLERAIEANPALGQTLWRAVMVEASIFRQRLEMARRPARERVAHLLCEQLHRLGPGASVIPLSQIDVADAVGLSAVHTNRVLQELRKRGALSAKRTLQVVDRARLQELAGLDGRYRDPREALSRWAMRFAP